MLKEESAWTVPGEFNLAGLSSGPCGEVLAWATRPNTVLRMTPALEPERSWVLPSHVLPLAAWSQGETLEVITRVPPMLHQFGSEGSPVQSVHLEVDGRLIAAARGTQGWYLLSGSVSAGAGHLRLDGHPGQAFVKTSGTITPDDSGVWLTDLHYPFEARRFRDDWSRDLTLLPPKELLDSMRSALGQVDFSVWASLPVAILTHGYMQTIADHGNDRRLLVVYDNAGAVVSSAVLNVPLGLMLGTRNHRLYGARRTDIVEIVGYSYEWEPDQCQPTCPPSPASSGSHTN